MEEAQVKSHQSVDWYAYFKSIRQECPWSYAAYLKGLISIVEYTGDILPLQHYEARMYVFTGSDSELQAVAKQLDHGEDEWLYSFPGYGDYATPVPVLIQQNRRRLQELRDKLNGE